MSLDITAYRGCRITTPTFDECDEPIGDVVRPWVNGDFPDRADEVVHQAWYTYEGRMDFAAGPYGNYGRWRLQLAAIGGYRAEDAWEKRMTAAPFLELVDFADNEGTIGPLTAAKLAEDFAAHEATAATRLTGSEMTLYRRWRAAFEMARDGGFVLLH